MDYKSPSTPQRRGGGGQNKPIGLRLWEIFIWYSLQGAPIGTGTLTSRQFLNFLRDSQITHNHVEQEGGGGRLPSSPSSARGGRDNESGLIRQSRGPILEAGAAVIFQSNVSKQRKPLPNIATPACRIGQGRAGRLHRSNKLMRPRSSLLSKHTSTTNVDCSLMSYFQFLDAVREVAMNLPQYSQAGGGGGGGVTSPATSAFAQLLFVYILPRARSFGRSIQDDALVGETLRQRDIQQLYRQTLLPLSLIYSYYASEMSLEERSARDRLDVNDFVFSSKKSRQRLAKALKKQQQSGRTPRTPRNLPPPRTNDRDTPGGYATLIREEPLVRLLGNPSLILPSSRTPSQLCSSLSLRDVLLRFSSDFISQKNASNAIVLSKARIAECFLASSSMAQCDNLPGLSIREFFVFLLRVALSAFSWSSSPPINKLKALLMRMGQQGAASAPAQVNFVQGRALNSTNGALLIKGLMELQQLAHRWWVSDGKPRYLVSAPQEVPAGRQILQELDMLQEYGGLLPEQLIPPSAIPVNTGSDESKSLLRGARSPPETAGSASLRQVDRPPSSALRTPDAPPPHTTPSRSTPHQSTGRTPLRQAQPSQPQRTQPSDEQTRSRLNPASTSQLSQSPLVSPEDRRATPATSEGLQTPTLPGSGGSGRRREGIGRADESPLSPLDADSWNRKVRGWESRATKLKQGKRQ